MLLLSSMIFIAYIWIIFPLILLVLLYIRGRKRKNTDIKNKLYPISIVIAAHNEEAILKKRISNIFESNYPKELLEVFIVSDGSTDDSKELIRDLTVTFQNLRFIDIQPQAGRSNAHNIAMKMVENKICIFTDAETSFEENCIRNLVYVFNDENVGFASGVLGYTNIDDSNIGQSASYYWKFEMWLRELESKLGWFAVGTGACCAVRRDLYQEIPATGDVDFTTPLDVVMQGYKCTHVTDAIAWDSMASTPGQEFKARVRMTAKNLHGTIVRWNIRGLFVHPIYSWILVSHKIARWLMPLGMLGVLFGNIMILSSSMYAQVFFGMQLLFYLLALAGFFRIKLPLSGAAYSFCIVNAGFLIGVLRVITLRVPSKYKPMNQG